MISISTSHLYSKHVSYFLEINMQINFQVESSKHFLNRTFLYILSFSGTKNQAIEAINPFSSMTALLPFNGPLFFSFLTENKYNISTYGWEKSYKVHLGSSKNELFNFHLKSQHNNSFPLVLTRAERLESMFQGPRCPIMRGTNLRARMLYICCSLQQNLHGTCKDWFGKNDC